MRPVFPVVTLLVCLALSLASAAAGLPGRVLRIVDGDTLILDVRGAHYRVDLDDIDAPEANQPWGQDATEQLRQAVAGTFIVVDTTTVDRDRVSGHIEVRGRDVALDLLVAGLAWSTVPTDAADSSLPTAAGVQNGPPTHPYTQAEATARAARRGLWSDAQPVPPWVWRRQRGGLAR